MRSILGRKMKVANDNFKISRLLQHWYSRHKRDLPWRETTDPYKIWISEIILQQTRVNQGLDYYLRFIARFPDAASLANAEENQVLKLWQGLGYYSRARNLHAAAKQITTQFGGKFPDHYSDIISLKGIGDYTAAAIASIAYKLPYAVVDGNVYRVLSRLFAIDTPINSSEGKKLFAETAQAILDPKHAALHNQAIMDLGAMVCTPRQPLCVECPVQSICMAYEKNEIVKYPVKTRKNSVKTRYFNYFHIVQGENTWIHKRTEKDIWKNLYEFPMLETENPMDFLQLQRTGKHHTFFSKLENAFIEKQFKTKHILSHQIIDATFYQIIVPDTNSKINIPLIIKIKADQLPEFPISSLTLKYLETL